GTAAALPVCLADLLDVDGLLVRLVNVRRLADQGGTAAGLTARAITIVAAARPGAHGGGAGDQGHHQAGQGEYPALPGHARSLLRVPWACPHDEAPGVGQVSNLPGRTGQVGNLPGRTGQVSNLPGRTGQVG